MSKWLPLEPSVLLLNDPTRGVDVETKREIYLALRAMAAEGKAVVLLSTDTPELVHLCDRVMVFNKGRVAATLPHAEASEEAIVAAAMGVQTSADAAGRSGLMLGQGARLYWAIQWRRNEGLGALFLVLAVFAAIYAILFPGIFAVGAMAKFVQGWFPTAMVAAAETIVMLTGGIDLSVGPMVSLGSVVAASTMQGPLGDFRRRPRASCARRGRGRDRRRFRRDRPISGDHRDACALVRPARRCAAHHAAARRIRASVACPNFSPAVIRPRRFCSCCSSSSGSSIRRRRWGSD